MAGVYGTIKDDYVDTLWASDGVTGSNVPPTTTDGSDGIEMFGGNDTVYAGGGYDYVDGGSGSDTLYGGTEPDDLYGGTSGLFDVDTDVFGFNTTDSGDIFADKADIIHDFTDGYDEIKLNGYYTNAGDTSAPADGQYGIWQNGSNWVVTWNAFNDDGFHDVIVQGGDPHGDVKTWYDDVIIW